MKWSPPKIIFEDNHLLVVEKPVNIPSQEDDSGDPDLLTILKQDLKERYQKPGNVFLGLVHRLDRPVGGVMVLAKTSKAASRLAEQIRNGEFKKVYLAIAHGKPEKSCDRLEHFLLKDNRVNKTAVVSGPQPGALQAVLEYEVLAHQANLSLVKINLHTGRSHQIRVQLEEIGHPLFGDQKYGADKNKPGQQIALWSVEIGFMHPTKDEMMTFRALPPEEYPWNIFKAGSTLD